MSRIAKLIVIVIVLAMVGCSYENTATVTIDTGIRKQAQLSLLDKVIAWLSLSQPLQADQPPAEVSFEELTLTVSASDMSNIVQHYSRLDIINNNGKITLEVPAGSQRAFEIVASRREMTGSLIPRYYGGIKTVDLSPGQNVNLDIEMGKLLYLGEYSVSSFSIDYENDSIQIIFNGYPTVPIRGALGFKIYYSPYGTTNNATFLGGTANWEILSGNQDGSSSISINTGIDLVYKEGYIGISIINKYGEGEIYFYQT